jgi:hypothetical protein
LNHIREQRTKNEKNLKRKETFATLLDLCDGDAPEKRASLDV